MPPDIDNFRPRLYPAGPTTPTHRGGPQPPEYLDDGAPFTLSAVATKLDAMTVEQVPLRGALGDRLYMFVDEDGAVRRLPTNPTASAIAGQTIRGPAIVMHRRDFVHY